MKYIWFFLFGFFSLYCQSNTNDTINFQYLDYVRRTPYELESNLEKLVYYLIKPAKREKDKVEIIFYWISQNIDYDIVGLLNNDAIDCSTESVMKNKKTVCSGYANLFKKMCDFARIRCEIISGMAKGYGYNFQRFDSVNHDWNSVFIDGRWNLVDVTWASGFCNKESYFRWINLKYLFSNPNQFIIDHLPIDEKWQLLDNPIDIDTFFSKNWDLKLNRDFSSNFGGIGSIPIITDDYYNYFSDIKPNKIVKKINGKFVLTIGMSDEWKPNVVQIDRNGESLGGLIFETKKDFKNNCQYLMFKKLNGLLRIDSYKIVNGNLKSNKGLIYLNVFN